MSDILLSFIMPTYNSSDYLSQTLESLIASIGKHKDIVEILCVDDGSTDNTVIVLESYQAKFPNLKIFQNEHGGVSRARNTALDNIQGQYVSFVDSDDLYERYFLDWFVSLNKDFDILFTDVRGLENNLKYINISTENKLEVFKNSLRIGEYEIEPGVAGKFFKTDIIKENNFKYNENLSVSEDVLFNFTFLTNSQNVLLSPIAFYKVTGTHSLMYFNEKNYFGQIEFVSEMRKLLSNYPQSNSRSLLEDKFIINAMTIYIDRYFGPLWLNKTYTLKKASQLLKDTIEKNDFHKAFVSDELDYSIGNRYVVFRKLLKYRQYKLCLIYNRGMDKVKGYERFRSK